MHQVELFLLAPGGDSSHLTEQNGTVTDGSMQQNITAKLKLLTTPEQRQVLRQTQWETLKQGSLAKRDLSGDTRPLQPPLANGV